MKILYLDLGMGAAGDMLSSALYELLDDKQKTEFTNIVNDLGIEGVSVTLDRSVKCGITGTHMNVLINGVPEETSDHHDHGREHDHGHEHDHTNEHHHEHDHEHHHHNEHEHDHHHHHNDMAGVLHETEHLNVSDKVRENVRKIYEMIAGAESAVHGSEVASVHFHEVGEKDALADITAVCILMEMLAPDDVVATPVCTGFGKVRCAHGILPVPAPATAELLKGIPAYSGRIEGELCTPTGAALVKYFVNSFEGMPVMTVLKSGYGMGRKDFEAANCIRAMLGEDAGAADDIITLSCNVDDMTAEAVAFAADIFLREGAVDVYTTNIGMKKGRQGIMINIMCTPADTDKFVSLMFRHTSTLGVRRKRFERYVLDRRCETVEGSFGSARLKISEGYGVRRCKIEYDDISSVAKEKNISVDEARKLIEKEISKDNNEN